MKTLTRDLTRRHAIAIALGVVLAGVPLLAFDYWMSRVVERRAVDEITTVAKRAIALAESRVGHAITVLDGLAEKGIASCSGVQLDAMRDAVFATPPLKEIAIVDPEGGTICSHFGTMPGRRIVLSSTPLRGARRTV